MKYLVCVLFCFFIYLNNHASVRNLSVLEGLPSNTIRCFFKDSRGFLWIGTDAGLCRYDGNGLKVFDESNGLKFVDVWSIIEDENNHIWFSVYGYGLAEYDGEKFNYYKATDKNQNHNKIRKVVFSKQFNYLLLATEDGLGIFNKKEFKFINKKERFQITGIDFDYNQTIITSSYQGVYKLNLFKDLSKSNLDSLFFKQITYSSYIQNGDYYASGPDNNLIKVNLKNKEIIKNWNLPIIWNYSTLNDEIFLSTWNVVEPKGGLYKLHNDNLIQIESIPSNNVWSVFSDENNKQLWVGTLDKGIFIINLKNEIQYFNKDNLKLSSFEPNEVFLDNTNRLWIGAKDNIIILNKNGTINKLIDNELLLKKISNFLISKNKNVELKNHIYPLKLKYGFTTFNFHQDEFENVWVNTTWGIICLDKKLNVKAFLSTDGGQTFINEKKEIIFFQLYGATLLAKNVDSLVENQLIKLNSEKGNIPNDVIKIIKQNNNTFWIASHSSGLYKYENNKFISINLSTQFNQNQIKDIIIKKKNELVIGTNSGRVYFYNIHNNSFKLIKILYPNLDIIGSTIKFIEYSNGYYLIGTNKGINILKNGVKLKLITLSEGLSEIDFIHAFCDNSFLWVTTTNGLQKLDILKIVKIQNKINSKLRLLNIEVNGKIYNSRFKSSWEEIKVKEIILKYNENSINLDFGLINLLNNNQTEFRFRIKEINKNWSRFSSINNLKLNGLNSGRYNIEVQARNIGLGIIYPTLNLNLKILPPFWKTWWFISLCIVFIGLIIYMAFLYRINQIKKREKEKSELQNKLLETKLEALRAEMNPHFIFNAMNSIQNFIIDNDSINAMFYLGEFSKLIRQTLENASEKFMTLDKEIKFLESYLNVQKMRFDNIDTLIKIDSSVNKFSTLIPPLIIQPFIENAFEHAFYNDLKIDKKVDIHFYIENNLLCCSIIDNGVGFTKGKSKSLHKSFGLNLTRERLDLLNKEFETNTFEYKVFDRKKTDRLLSGTEIKITFLLNPAYNLFK